MATVSINFADTIIVFANCLEQFHEFSTLIDIYVTS